jgi:hypothetical protein
MINSNLQEILQRANIHVKIKFELAMRLMRDQGLLKNKAVKFDGISKEPVENLPGQETSKWR